MPASDPKAALLLDLADALHRYGLPAPMLEEAVENAARDLGIRARLFAAPTSILAAFGEPGEQRTALLRLAPAQMDLDKLSRVYEVLRTVTGAADLPTARDALAAIALAPPPYPLAVEVLAWGVASGAVARFFGGGANEIAVASTIAICNGTLAAYSLRHRTVARLFEAIAAFVGAAATMVVAHYLPISVPVTTIAALVAIFPGIALTLALTELASQHLMSGSARLFAALLVFVQIAFGVALATSLFGPFPEPTASVPLPGWTEGLAMFGVLCAGPILFRTPTRDIGWVALAGLLGFGVSRLGAVAVGPALGAFPGALAIGIAANVYHRRLGRPAIVVLIPGILLLVPGSIGFRSVSALLADDVLGAIQLAFTMTLVAISIVAGTLVAQGVTRDRRL